MKDRGNTYADVSGQGQYLGAEDGYGSVSTPGMHASFFLDIRPVLDRVRAALKSHATQVQWIETLPEPDQVSNFGDEGFYLIGSYALSNNIVAPLLSHEFYAAV